MAESIANRVNRWDLSGAKTTTDALFNQVHERVFFLQHLHYNQYLPTLGAEQFDFETRLEKWLDNLPSEQDQQVLLELVPQIIFLGREEFTKMYQAAFRGPITRWVVDRMDVKFTDVNLQTKLTQEIHKHTWFCALSDSMPISDFCHANHLGGIEYRPDLRALSTLGDLHRILNFMNSHSDAEGQPVPLTRIVALEDFIGSGTQLRDAMCLISDLLANNVPILLVPLVICPEGEATIRSLFGGNPLFRLEPVLRLENAILVHAGSTAEPGSLPARVKDLVGRCYGQVRGNGKGNPLYSPFGFRETGALVVLVSNTPANTLPIIHHRSSTWEPLFPRSARVK